MLILSTKIAGEKVTSSCSSTTLLPTLSQALPCQLKFGCEIQTKNSPASQPWMTKAFVVVRQNDLIKNHQERHIQRVASELFSHPSKKEREFYSNSSPEIICQRDTTWSHTQSWHGKCGSSEMYCIFVSCTKLMASHATVTCFR